jgi:putative endonuclease
MSNKYFLYILVSLKDGRFYTGTTNDLERRISDHNRNKSKYYKNRGPYRLAYFEEFNSRFEAVKRERHLKTPSGGIQKSSLVDSFNKELLKKYNYRLVEHP